VVIVSRNTPFIILYGLKLFIPLIYGKKNYLFGRVAKDGLNVRIRWDEVKYVK
jgi:hypothetical protein